MFTDMYVGDQPSPRKIADSGSPIAMIRNILDFLDASPMTLFEGAPEDSSEREVFFESNIESFISCMTAADESVRRLAGRVAKKLFADTSVMTLVRASKRLASPQFKANFWKLT